MEKIIKYRIQRWDREHFRDAIRATTDLPQKLENKKNQIVGLLNTIVNDYIIDKKLKSLLEDSKIIHVFRESQISINPDFIGIGNGNDYYGNYYVKDGFDKNSVVRSVYTRDLCSFEVDSFPINYNDNRKMYRYSYDGNMTELLKEKVPEEILFSLRNLIFEYADLKFDHDNFLYDKYIMDTWGYRCFLGQINTLTQLYEYNKDYYKIFVDNILSGSRLLEKHKEEENKPETKKDIINHLKEILADDI